MSIRFDAATQTHMVEMLWRSGERLVHPVGDLFEEKMEHWAVQDFYVREEAKKKEKK